MTDVTIQTADGDFYGYLAKPQTDTPAPGILVIQEIFGVNEGMRKICDSLASSGYMALCPDLFWRQEPGIQLTDKTDKEWERAFELFNGFDVDKGIEDLKASLSFLRGYEGCSGKAGSIGYCLGGKMAYLMATRSDADCNVAYYGVGLDELLDEAKNITKPLLMHIAEKDKFVPKEAREKIVSALNGNEFIDMHVYDGVDHAFARPDGQHYDENAATKANVRTADFLATHLV